MMRNFFVLPKLFPWYMAQTRRIWVDAATLPLRFSLEYWNTFDSVFDPKPR